MSVADVRRFLKPPENRPAQAALEPFACDLQVWDGSLSLEEFYPKAFSKQIRRALDIARYGLKYAWRSKHQGLHRLRKLHANK